MNNVELIGHVAVDTKVGNGVVSSLLAVHRIYKSKDGIDTDFIPLSIFGRQADNFSKMVSKGQMIGIDGQLKTSTYADQNGEKRYGWSVVVAHFYLLNGSNHEGQPKLSQQTVSDSMHSSAQNPQQQLYDQYHQQTPQTPQPAIDKQLDDLDTVLDHAQIQPKQQAAKPAKPADDDEPIEPLPPLGNNQNNRSHVSGNDFNEKVIQNQPTVEQLQKEIEKLKSKALPFD